MLNFSAGYLAENLHGLTKETPWNRTRKAVVFGAESMEKISETYSYNFAELQVVNRKTTDRESSGHSFMTKE